jgi:hypothetical protein
MITKVTTIVTRCKDTYIDINMQTYKQINDATVSLQCCNSAAFLFLHLEFCTTNRRIKEFSVFFGVFAHI